MVYPRPKWRVRFLKGVDSTGILERRADRIESPQQCIAPGRIHLKSDGATGRARDLTLEKIHGHRVWRPRDLDFAGEVVERVGIELHGQDAVPETVVV